MNDPAPDEVVRAIGERARREWRRTRDMLARGDYPTTPCAACKDPVPLSQVQDVYDIGVNGAILVLCEGCWKRRSTEPHTPPDEQENNQ